MNTKGFTSIRHLCKTLRKGSESFYKSATPHIPVMLDEVVDYLKPRSGETILDMTFGAGGHSKKILETCPDVRLICLDRDLTAVSYAQELAKQFSCVIPLLGKFSDLPQLLKSHNIKQNSIDGILFDFGCSSMQLDQAERGFSLSKNGPLDMRMGGNREPGMF